MARIYLDVKKDHFGAHVMLVREDQMMASSAISVAKTRNKLAHLHSLDYKAVSINPDYVVTVR